MCIHLLAFQVTNIVTYVIKSDNTSRSNKLECSFVVFTILHLNRIKEYEVNRVPTKLCQKILQALNSRGNAHLNLVINASLF